MLHRGARQWLQCETVSCLQKKRPARDAAAAAPAVSLRWLDRRLHGWKKASLSQSHRNKSDTLIQVFPGVYGLNRQRKMTYQSAVGSAEDEPSFLWPAELSSPANHPFYWFYDASSWSCRFQSTFRAALIGDQFVVFFAKTYFYR